MDGTPVLRVWTLKRSLTWKGAYMIQPKDQAGFCEPIDAPRAEFPGIVGSCMTHGCSSVRKMHMLLMRLNPSKYPIEQEEYPFLPVNLKANSMKMAQIMFETTFNAPVMNCRQNEKGSRGLSIKIKAVASTRKEYSFWIGRSILVSLSTFEQVLSSSDACCMESIHVAYSMLLPFT
ncbi:hypothetical protein CXB51_012721 [Gossypium anomalum]|uniref:Uncharacterized protein n=1 Tax=Gossypium anomalum TaxID=47600 RepID=A0A8J6D8G5_9ROSI|nr:hypothetical protein CXB51_012721 [Gossypium anomalum]